MKPPVRPFVVLGLLKELRIAAEDDRPLAVGGALAPQLVKELAGDRPSRADPGAVFPSRSPASPSPRQGGAAPGAVREAGPEGAAAYVHVLAGTPTAEDAAVLRRAHRARVPAVVLARERYDVPYVLPTHVVLVPPGQGFPLDELARVLTARLGESATALAARLPVLRAAVCETLVSRFSRRNGLIGAAVFVPGVDTPVLTLNELRLVLRIAAAHGEEISNERLPELLAVVGGGLALRTLARQVVDLVPGVAWAVKGAIAYAGTRALGEAAVRHFGARSASRA